MWTTEHESGGVCVGGMTVCVCESVCVSVCVGTTEHESFPVSGKRAAGC